MQTFNHLSLRAIFTLGTIAACIISGFSLFSEYVTHFKIAVPTVIIFGAILIISVTIGMIKNNFRASFTTLFATAFLTYMTAVLVSMGLLSVFSNEVAPLSEMSTGDGLYIAGMNTLCGAAVALFGALNFALVQRWFFGHKQ